MFIILSKFFQYKTARSSELKQILEKARQRAEKLNDKHEEWIKEWIILFFIFCGIRMPWEWLKQVSKRKM